MYRGFSCYIVTTLKIRALSVTNKLQRCYNAYNQIIRRKDGMKAINKDSEKYLERRLAERVRKQGGVALKYTSPYITGLPDRIVIRPKNNITFVELKSKGKKPSPLQEEQMTRLRALGCSVIVIDSEESLNAFLNERKEAEQ